MCFLQSQTLRSIGQRYIYICIYMYTYIYIYIQSWDFWSHISFTSIHWFSKSDPEIPQLPVTRFCRAEGATASSKHGSADTSPSASRLSRLSRPRDSKMKKMAPNSFGLSTASWCPNWSLLTFPPNFETGDRHFWKAGSGRKAKDFGHHHYMCRKLVENR